MHVRNSPSSVNLIYVQWCDKCKFYSWVQTLPCLLQCFSKITIKDLIDFFIVVIELALQSDQEQPVRKKFPKTRGSGNGFLELITNFELLRLIAETLVIAPSYIYISYCASSSFWSSYELFLRLCSRGRHTSLMFFFLSSFVFN